ncbi:hypothetical protein RRG08_033944 [Elysia crispata]|uniref:Uncharacterized protein n=1 Tax=Elysia crispata TaxID=231223 RepID=A0AAE0YSD7_9GAST|nr:hypothetical protein RRG08_033944 [Elysia crispata]
MKGNRNRKTDRKDRSKWRQRDPHGGRHATISLLRELRMSEGLREQLDLKLAEEYKIPTPSPTWQADTSPTPDTGVSMIFSFSLHSSRARQEQNHHENAAARLDILVFKIIPRQTSLSIQLF